MKRGVCIIIFFLFLFSGVVSSLGVSPSSARFNFEPGFETEIEYHVIAREGQEIELNVSGDLFEYVTLSEKKVIGSGNFKAKVKLPDSIETPGRHRIGIIIAEKIDKELAVMIGTSVRVISAIDIYVPYPGRYLEVELRGHDVNVGEPVNFELDIKSQGKEDVEVVPRIEIFSQEGAKIDELLFNSRTIASQELLELKKTLDTTNYNAGNYKAIAIVDYGVLATSEVEFRVGNLHIDILNYTDVIEIGKLEKFEIAIGSGWNDNIDGAYAQVDFLNASKIIESFKTTTTDLKPWETKVIIGYFDTINFSEGTYDANITLFYFGKERGQTTNKEVKIVFFKKPAFLIWYIIGGSGIALLIITLAIKFLILKNGRKKKK